MKTTHQNIQSNPDGPLYDVIIAGAGPVGLFLACELALAGCSVLVLEKAEQPGSPLKRLPFGLRGLNALSVEALYRRGLLDQLQAHKTIKAPHMLPVADQQKKPLGGGHFAGIQIPVGKIDHSQFEYRLPAATPTSLFSELEELETVLARRAAALGVEIKRGCPITGFEQDQHLVTVACEGMHFTAKWLVGCDGSRSVIRKTGGFDFAGTEPEFTGYTTLVDIADPEKLNPGRNVTEKGMYMQSQPGYVIMQDFDNGAFHQSRQPVTLQRVQQLLRHISGTNVTLTALHVATTWTDRARQATDYRNGRILLAGDAAHIHSPLGGQGLNLGLGDAMNLGWKLAAHIKGHAPEGLLDSYFTERHPIGQKVLDWSRAQVAIMKPTESARALNAIFRDLMDTKDGATYFAGRIWGIFTHYNLGGRHPLEGRSVPNFTFADGLTIGNLMYDGLGILLDFGNNHSLKTLIEKYAGKIKYIVGAVTDELGLSALLIRPDGFIAWAGEEEVDVERLRQLLVNWFGK